MQETGAGSRPAPLRPRRSQHHGVPDCPWQGEADGRAEGWVLLQGEFGVLGLPLGAEQEGCVKC